MTTKTIVKKAELKDAGSMSVIMLAIVAAGVGIWYFMTQTLTAKAKAAAAAAAGSGTSTSTGPSLVISNSGESVNKGSKLNFTFANFNPFDLIGVSVEGGGGVTVASDSSGSGSGGFTDGDPTGIYTLQASDSLGNKAVAKFIVG